MKTLVEARWSTIPTLEELSQPDCVRRLRDQVYLGSLPTHTHQTVRWSHRQKLPNLMVQSVSASVTDTKFRLGEQIVGLNPCPVGQSSSGL